MAYNAPAIPARAAEVTKRHQLILGDVNAYGLRRNAVVANGHNRTAGTAANQVQGYGEHHQHQNKASHKGRELRHAGCTHGAVDENLTVHHAQGIGALHAEMQAGAVYTNIEVVQDVLNDLAESQGDDGQIVALEPQGRNTHQQAQQGGGRERHAVVPGIRG